MLQCLRRTASIPACHHIHTIHNNALPFPHSFLNIHLHLHTQYPKLNNATVHSKKNAPRQSFEFWQSVCWRPLTHSLSLTHCHSLTVTHCTNHCGAARPRDHFGVFLVMDTITVCWCSEYECEWNVGVVSISRNKRVGMAFGGGLSSFVRSFVRFVRFVRFVDFVRFVRFR